jgi:hypothetical protein
LARTYRLRAIPNGQRSSDGQRYTNYSFTVPPEIASKVPDGMEFECSVDEDGIHYRPVSSSRVNLPSSTGEATGDASGEKPKRPQLQPVEA